MVDILMATYNGERFVEAQILSIIAQTYNNWRLIVHDDGSKDRTLAIVRKWSQIDTRITIVDDGIICGGAAKNFMHLLNYSNSEYVMFCDQDDIWFDNKVELMYKEILNMDSLMPRVVYSNSYVWYPSVGITGLATFTHASNLQELLFLNSGIQGCVAIFDNKVRDHMKSYHGEISMHDHLLHLIAVTLSNVHFLDVPLMLYRNHGGNVTGDTRVSLVNNSALFRNQSIPVVDDCHYETVKRFQTLYSGYLTEKDKNTLDIYIKLPHKAYFSRLYLVIKNQFKLYNSVVLLLVKCIVRRYKNNS